jgi:hypothetical protein
MEFEVILFKITSARSQLNGINFQQLFAFLIAQNQPFFTSFCLSMLLACGVFLFEGSVAQAGQTTVFRPACEILFKADIDCVLLTGIRIVTAPVGSRSEGS